MLPGKKLQNNAMLYTLITFVALFIITTTVAVIYYVKFEEQRKIAETSRDELGQVISSQEQRKGLGKIVGEKQRSESYLGKMTDYLDEMVTLVTGHLTEDTSAQAKMSSANSKVNEMLETLGAANLDPNNETAEKIGLLQIIEKLKTTLDNTVQAAIAFEEQLTQLHKQFEDSMATGFEKEQALLAEKEQYKQQVENIKLDYDKLKALLKSQTEEQVQILMADLEKERNNFAEQKQQLLKTQAELKIAQSTMSRAKEELAKLVPPPDSEIAAFTPDGKIILIDDQAQIVHLNIGSDDHVYPGLTFSVYDKSMPIPRNGRGKAEIEVFNVGKNISAARILPSKTQSPIILDDIIANLIWDSDKENVFVVSGEFDLDDDGDIDRDGADKTRAIIKKWGGRVDDIISVDTDFLILGQPPRVLRKPTFEQMEVDPMAMEKYEASLQKRVEYKEAQNQAKILSVPVLNTERFLYFIGYKSQSGRPEAF